MWVTRRITLLPYAGRLWPLAESYRSNPTGFDVTLGLALLNVVYVGMALAAVWFWRANPGVLLIATFIVVRTAFFTQVQTCEPRYVLECFSGVLAVAAQFFRRSVQGRRAQPVPASAK